MRNRLQGTERLMFSGRRVDVKRRRVNVSTTTTAHLVMLMKDECRKGDARK